MVGEEPDRDEDEDRGRVGGGESARRASSTLHRNLHRAQARGSWPGETARVTSRRSARTSRKPAALPMPLWRAAARRRQGLAAGAWSAPDPTAWMSERADLGRSATRDPGRPVSGRRSAARLAGWCDRIGERSRVCRTRPEGGMSLGRSGRRGRSRHRAAAARFRPSRCFLRHLRHRHALGLRAHDGGSADHEGERCRPTHFRPRPELAPVEEDDHRQHEEQQREPRRNLPRRERRG